MPFDVVSYAAGRKKGGGSGGDITTQPLNVTENGTYTAPSGRAYTPVNVNVKQPEDYTGEYDITPSQQLQTLPTVEKRMLDNVTIHPIPEEYIIPRGTLSIDENGEHDVKQYETVNVHVEPVLQEKSVDVFTNGQTVVNPDDDYDGLSEVTVNVSVPQIEVEPLIVTENGEYTPVTGKAFGHVTVNVPGDILTEELEVTKNGTYTAPFGKAYTPVKVNVAEGEEYEGPYEAESVISSDKTLETSGLLMKQDVIIKKITILEVSNVSGGYTVTIGK